jgi:hypothetical protein
VFIPHIILLLIMTFMSSGNGTQVFSEYSFTVIAFPIVISAFFFRLVDTVAIFLGFVLAGVACGFTTLTLAFALALEKENLLIDFPPCCGLVFFLRAGLGGGVLPLRMTLAFPHTEPLVNDILSRSSLLTSAFFSSCFFSFAFSASFLASNPIDEKKLPPHQSSHAISAFFLSSVI